MDDRIWFRNFQITWSEEKGTEPALNEIGPRFVLQLVRIFSDSFKGETLFENEEYVSPNIIRSEEKKKKGAHYNSRKEEKIGTKHRKFESVIDDDEVDDIFKA